MSLLETLDEYARAGTLSRQQHVPSVTYSHFGPLGTHRGNVFQVGVVIIVRNSAIRALAETWHGKVRIHKPPLEANWPAVKAIRELRASGGVSEDAVARLLQAVLPKNR